MGIHNGAPVPPKPDMQSQTDPGLNIAADAPQPLSTVNTPPTLSESELNRMFGSAD
jgi:hypothetical protein